MLNLHEIGSKKHIYTREFGDLTENVEAEKCEEDVKSLKRFRGRERK